MKEICMKFLYNTFGMHMQKNKKDTSWQNVAGWYNKLVKNEGHYYHQNTVIPRSLKLLELNKDSSLLDLACGQGVLARHIPRNMYYIGIDASAGLINFAKNNNRDPRHAYMVKDITQPLHVEKTDFTHAAIILALQNIENPEKVLVNAYQHLQQNGMLLIVLNHPCFRIPRQSSWGIDEQNKTQFRRINRYLSFLKIPINMHPGEKNSPVTWSFHFPLSSYSEFLCRSGFSILKIEEWISDKKSVGKAAKMENRSRDEFPLFMAILAKKEK